MDNKTLISKIEREIKKAPSDRIPCEDMFALVRNIEKENFELAHITNKRLRKYVKSSIKQKYDVGRFFDLYRKTLLFDAPYYFDEYLLYLEIDRKPQDRFYQPRRRIMKRVTNELQNLVDGKLDELFLSMPPRVGKTTLVLMFVTWLLGRDSEKSNLYSAYSDTITKKFYEGVLEILNDPYTYLWHDVFPNSSIVKTDSKDETINLDRKKRYPSLTARSLYGTLNGACDCNGILIADDLLSGIEEALNKDRLISAWGKVENNLITRAKEEAKKLWIGTRWSLIDPIGNRIETITNDKNYKDYRFKVINLAALDENDESQFDYDYGVGYSTTYYRQRRASFERNDDMASWDAQFQQEPIEREGTIFNPESFRYYNGVLPDSPPDNIFIVVDPAFGGGDFVSAPICFQYGEDIFIHDVVYDNNDKSVTQPLLVNAVIKYNVAAMQIELNKSTETYKEGIVNGLKEKGIRINLTSKAAPPTTAKRQRIFNKAPEIRDRMIFREPGTRSKPYELFMQNVMSFKFIGKNKNDDAPDSLAMAMDMVTHPIGMVEVFKRTI